MTVKQLSNVLVAENKNSYISFDSWAKIKSTSSYQWSQRYWKSRHEIENQIPTENQEFLKKLKNCSNIFWKSSLETLKRFRETKWMFEKWRFTFVAYKFWRRTRLAKFVTRHLFSAESMDIGFGQNLGERLAWRGWKWSWITLEN